MNYKALPKKSKKILVSRGYVLGYQKIFSKFRSGEACSLSKSRFNSGFGSVGLFQLAFFLSFCLLVYFIYLYILFILYLYYFSILHRLQKNAERAEKTLCVCENGVRGLQKIKEPSNAV